MHVECLGILRRHLQPVMNEANPGTGQSVSKHPFLRLIERPVAHWIVYKLDQKIHTECQIHTAARSRGVAKCTIPFCHGAQGNRRKTV